MLLNLLYVFGIIFLTQIIFFIFAAINKTDKVTDLSYGLTFVIGAIAALAIGGGEIPPYKALLLGLIVAWGARISSYLFIRILKTGKDKRFDGIRENVKSFAGFWTLQAFSVFIILAPVSYTLLLAEASSVALLTILGAVFALIGLLVETVADIQKFDFKSNPANKGLWIMTGLWGYSRHPNYLGEIMFWIGVFIATIPYLSGIAYLTVISPLFISFLIIFVSGIPTLEKSYDKRYADNKEYQAYKNRVGNLLPKLF